MKYLLYLLLFTTTHLLGQNKMMPSTTVFPIDKGYAKSSFDGVEIRGNVRSFLENKLQLPNEYAVVLDTIIASQTGEHYTYHIAIKGVEIYNAIIKVNTTHSTAMGKKITAVFVSPFIKEIYKEEKFPTSVEIGHFFSKIPADLKQEKVYFFNGIALVPSIKLSYSLHQNNPWLTIIDATGKVIYQKDLNLYFNNSDTLVKGTVFNPDPLTTAGVVYGAPYADNADNDFSYLLNEIDTVSFYVNNTIFALESDYVKITEHSNPNIPPVTVANGEFFYTRSAAGFEDVNAFYHLNKMQNHIQNLGFTNLVNYQINVDTHAQNGQDNSSFSAFFAPPRLSFGEGGVDDAEDADVIIHEYGHAIANSAAPNTNVGTERSSLDEALGDYLAASYSRSIKEYRWDEVFTWDGHNEFWGGRFASSTAHYPEDLALSVYADVPIFSATLMQIWEELGRATTDKILLESVYSWSANMSMADAAQLFYQADQNLNNGINQAVICDKFIARGLMTTCPSYATGIKATIAQQWEVKIANTLAFAEGKGNATIQFNKMIKGNYTIYAISGQQLKKVPFEGTITLNPNEFESGIYLMEISTKWGDKTLKLMKF